eukprot:TRINITY_DN12688_c0_g1_i1.p2 TRINITY_DN12688_c0_g1~~TRINITY_DN12688_c0_g1_i1.p2  ORF type:complete len:169 (+),score=46.85 TRINITY_DN12688_c0_g1_i1:985-1491(+)
MTTQIPEHLHRIRKFVIPLVGNVFSSQYERSQPAPAVSALKPSRFTNFFTALETTIHLVISELTDAAVSKWMLQMPVFVGMAMERTCSFSFVVKVFGCKEVFIPLEQQLKDAPKLLAQILQHHTIDTLLQEEESTRKKRVELNNEKATFTAALKELQRITKSNTQMKK